MKRKPSPATSKLGAFFELTKPRITFLILVSTALGVYLGSQGKINSNQFALTIIGTFLLAGGAGAINHFVEKDLDKLMDRTQSRPIPAGIISSKNACHNICRFVRLGSFSITGNIWNPAFL